MTARAAAAEATGQRILDAAVELFWEQLEGDLRLEDVATRAGVTVQTVIRRFESKDGLFAAAFEREISRVQAERMNVTPGDYLGAIRNLMDHYESYGNKVIRMLAASHIPAVRDVADRGKCVHRDWCAKAFGPALAKLGAGERKRRLAQLVAVCDVQTWALLRRESGLSRAQTELALIELLQPLAGGFA